MKKAFRKTFKQVSAIALALGVVVTSAGFNKVPVYAQQGEKKTTDSKTIEDLNKTALSVLSNSNNKLSKEEDKKDPKEVVRIIVELNEEPAIEKTKDDDYTNQTKKIEKEVKNNQSDVIKKVEELTGASVINQSSYLVNSFSIEAARGYIDQIKSLKGVKNVYEASSVKTEMDSALEIGNVLNAWKNGKKTGYQGEGVVVSIIDTGVNYEHKDMALEKNVKTKHSKSWWENQIKLLGYGKYYSKKVPFGYSYSNGNDEVLNDRSTHGYHVAGITAANGKPNDGMESIQGVAPKAQVIGMQVFTADPNNSSAYTDDIVKAIEDSVKLDADVINMSLGSDSGFDTDADFIEAAVEKAYQAGVVSAISAGNSGTSDSLRGDNTSYKEAINLVDDAMIGSPSAYKNSLSVASYNNNSVYQDVLKIKQNGKEIGSYPATTVDGDKKWSDLKDTYELVDCGKGNKEECEKVDVKGKIAVIKRGDITFTQKAANAIDAGAIGVVLYNSDAYPNAYIAPSVDSKIPFVSISNNAGKELLKNMKDNGATGYSFAQGKDFKENVNAGQNKEEMSNFSSWGPTPTLDIKPEISAPGGMIYSLNSGKAGYQYMSGTSRASPYVAGAEALIKQSMNKRKLSFAGSKNVDFMKEVIMNTAKPVINKNSQTPYSVRYQGAGLLDVADATEVNVTATYKGEACVELRQIPKGTKDVNFDITFTNYGSKKETYNFAPDKVYINGVSDSNEDVIKEVQGASVTYNQSQITVPKKGKVTVTATLHLTKDYTENSYVESFLHFENTDGISLGMPVLGFYGNWGTEKIIDSPIYEEDSYYGKTGLTDGKNTYLGEDYFSTQKEGQINKDYISISPNNDGVLDGAYPYLTMLRNANQMSMRIEDANGALVSDLGTIDYIQKSALEHEGQGSFATLINNKIGWDGTVYNQATGNPVTVKDGQYYFVIKANIGFAETDAQELKIPIKVDTVKPVISTTVGKIGDKYYAYITGSDDSSGLAGQMYVAVGSKNQKEGQKVLLKDLDSIENADGTKTYTYDITQQVNKNQGKENYLYVMGLDNAGNISDNYSIFIPSKIKTVTFDNLEDQMTVEKDGVYTFTGSLPAGSALTMTTADGTVSNATVSGTNFTCDVALVKGDNTIVVKATKDNKSIFEKTYKVKVEAKDKNAPTVDVDLQDSSANVVTTDKKTSNNATVNLIYVADNGADKINARVKANDENEFSIEAVSDITKEQLIKDTAKGQFITDILLKDKSKDYDLYVFHVKDVAGNEAEYDYYVYHGSVSDAKKFFNLSFKMTSENFSSVMKLNPSKLNNDGTYTIKGKVNFEPSVFKIGETPVKVNKDGTFTHTIPLNDGLNRVYIYAADVKPDGNVEKLYSNYAYRLYYSKYAPQINITNIVDAQTKNLNQQNGTDLNISHDKDVYVKNEDGVVYTNNSNYVIKGNVTDTYNNIEVSLNQKVLYRSMDMCEGKADYKIDYHAKLQEGDNYFTITASNIGGMVAQKVVKVKLDTKAPEKPVVNIDENGKVILAAADVDTAKVYYSVNGGEYQEYQGNFMLKDGDEIVVKSVDNAGNETFSDKYKVTVAKENKKVKVDLKDAEVSDIPTQLYTGKSIKPSVAVFYKDELLKKGKDYSVSYKNNKKEGTATVVITGKGKYKGKVTKKFKILKSSNQTKKEKTKKEKTKNRKQKK